MQNERFLEIVHYNRITHNINFIWGIIINTIHDPNLWNSFIFRNVCIGVIGISYKNRGKSFESLIEYTNKQYALKGWGLIEKMPTPWKVFYDKKTKSSKAFPEKSGVPDFMGISHGRGICFDAKSTKVSTRFDLKNIEEHQMKFLKQYQDQGGKSFFLIHFKQRQETFFAEFDFVYKYWQQWEEGGRASIPYDDLFFNCPLVHPEKGIALHYLKFVG